MKVGLTGGTGFIGKRVVRVLRERGHEVVCVVRTPEKATELTALGARLAKGDLLDRESLEAGFQGCEGVIHLAASYEVGIPWGSQRAEDSLKQNVEGTRNALEAALAAGAKKVVYTSSIVIYGTTDGQVLDEHATPRPPKFPYPHSSVYMLGKARAHAEVVQPLMARGAPLCAVLPGAVLGPGDHSNFSVIFELLSRGLPAPLGDARYVVVGVDDCALGHVLALEKGKAGASYLLTNERLSLRELHQRAVEVSGVKGSVLHLPDWLLRVNSAVLSLLERFGSLPSVMSSDGARGVMSTVTFLFDSSWTQRELGWTPAPIDGTLREIMAYELGKRGKRLPALLQGVNPRV